MDTNIFRTWQDLGNSSLKTFKHLESINTKAAEKLTTANFELANSAFELGQGYLSAMGKPNDIQTVLAEQTRLLSDYNERLIDAARTSADAIAESRARESR